MLKFRCVRFVPRSAQGFSLIEMMIALVIGLIVAGGAVSLIVAIDQSNSETIQSTRLTQELRSLAAVIANDIKRTRRIDDPIAMVGQGATTACPTTPKAGTNQPCYAVTTSSTASIAPDTDTSAPKCLSYGYTGIEANQDDTNYATKSRTLVYHAVRFAAVSSTVGSVVMDQTTFDPSGTGVTAGTTALPTANCPGPITGSTTYTLSSNEVNVTSLCFSSATNAGTCYFDTSTSTCKLNTALVPTTNEIDMCIAGKMLAGDKYTNTITRAFVQPIFVRSVLVN